MHEIPAILSRFPRFAGSVGDSPDLGDVVRVSISVTHRGTSSVYMMEGMMLLAATQSDRDGGW